MILTPTGMRLLVAVVEERSFTAAARRENATQSGVSQQIRRLEDRLGVRLIVREPGGARPTPAGERLYRRCAATLRGIAEAEDEARGFGRGLDGEAAIGLMSALTRCVMGPTLRDFMAEHPNASIRISEAISDQLIPRVAAAALDAAVVPAIEPLGPLTGRRLASVPEMLVARADGGSHMVPVDLRTLGPLRLVVPPIGNLRTRRILGHLALMDVEIDGLLQLDSMFGAFDFVANSDHVAIIPATMLLPEIRDRSLCVRPLAATPLTLDLMAIRPGRSSLSPVADAFMATLERHLLQVAAIWQDRPPDT